MKTYQLQFRDGTRLWRAGPTFQMIPALIRDFLDYMDSPTNRMIYGAQEAGDEDFRVVHTKCHNPQYRYSGGRNMINLRNLGQM